MSYEFFVYVAIACGVLGLVYSIWASQSILAASAGNERMQEIAGAIQEVRVPTSNAHRYWLVVVAIILVFTLGAYVAIGFVIGAVLSGCRIYWDERICLC